MVFNKESEFETAVKELLTNHGWEKEIIKNPTEEELIENWKNILYENNKGIDRLNGTRLSDEEMMQIIEQIKKLRTPLNLNKFINGKTVTITRNINENGIQTTKEISLKIYDRFEIAAGSSRYQIAEQPIFSSKSKILQNRRGDLMLLINGMPVIHIELKKSGIPISQAYNQIKKYSHEGIFTGIFSLIQVFVAMNPEDAVYFANPGPDGEFNPIYYFHWADFDNKPINDYKNVVSNLLSIPMAHQLIGFYTVPDDSDGTLKVLRSYQYYAASGILNKVSKISKDNWKEKGHQLGGYIWHTTGSGKTMTSFKSAQLISEYSSADKVIFLTDRIEIGTQTIKEYRSFSDENQSVQATENTIELVNKLKSTNPNDTLIVTSIQKMSNIKEEENGLSSYDIEKINKKRIVIIIDEAHRSTFGKMLRTIKDTFTNAVFFGFTGTPIHDENKKKMNTTLDIFGDELHRYSIADGIRDNNVLGFDPCKVLTYKDIDLRKAIALKKAKAKTEKEAISDKNKKRVYYYYLNKSKVPMVGYENDKGKYVKGIEDYIPNTQYLTEEHCSAVVKDIKDNWITLSVDGKFHALFATNSINEAIDYYRIIKKEIPEMKVTCLFDKNIDNTDGFEFKEDGLVEIIEDYNKRYDMNFTISTHSAFKKDIALRLAHKEIYKRIEKTPEKQLDLLIVVDQMLTGFDSKWINTLYIDKILEYENIIQAFSRTNRLFGPDKPFGTIRYYRKPHTMERNIEKAFEIYSGNKKKGIFVKKLSYNLKKMNEIFEEIDELFKNAGVNNFEKLPDDKAVKAKFASLFNQFNKYLEAAKIQGFHWDKLEYMFYDENKVNQKTYINLKLNEQIYLTLLQRYKELDIHGGSEKNQEIPYDIDSYLIEINTGFIDADYMNSKFKKWNSFNNEGSSKEASDKALTELHKTFATLSQEKQKYAYQIISDIQSGLLQVEEDKSFVYYITDYENNAKNSEIHKIADIFGLKEEKLREMKYNLNLTKNNINEYGRFDELMSTLNKSEAKKFFEAINENKELKLHEVNQKADKLLREYIISDQLPDDVKYQLNIYQKSSN